MPLCKYCGASIAWIKGCPVDMEPVYVHPDGDTRFVMDNGTAIWGREATDQDDKSECEVAFVPHFRTCRARRQHGGT